MARPAPQGWVKKKDGTIALTPTTAAIPIKCLSQSRTEQIRILGLVKPSAGGGKNYALVENTQRGVMKTHLMRSTDSAVYRLDGKTLADDQEFMVAPVGTAWTNYNYEGQLTLKVAVEAIETVTVPAGTFPNCYKFHKTALNAPPGETAEWLEWISRASAWSNGTTTGWTLRKTRP